VNIYPSLISSNILNIETTLKTLDPVCDGYHLDVMDDHFVPNLTWGPAFINAIVAKTELPVHVHLMVDNPEKWVGRLTLESKDSFIFHVETVQNFGFGKDIIQEVKKISGVKVGLAVNPKTDVSEIEGFVPLLDEILFMTVEPGFSGQKFMPEVVDKVAALRKMASNQSVSLKISMDGGIGPDNIRMLCDLGIDVVGIAAAIFSTKDYVGNLKNLYKIIGR
jgi:ribulose-phosphate 3-epimerase